MERSRAGSGRGHDRRADALDSMVMEPRDRTANLGLFAAAARRLGPRRARRHDPRPDRRPERRVRRRRAHRAGRGADPHPAPLADGLRPPPPDRLPGRLAAGHPARGMGRDRRGVLIVLRLQGLLELPIALFMIALVVVAEATLSAER